MLIIVYSLKSMSGSSWCIWYKRIWGINKFFWSRNFFYIFSSKSFVLMFSFKFYLFQVLLHCLLFLVHFHLCIVNGKSTQLFLFHTFILYNINLSYIIIIYIFFQVFIFCRIHPTNPIEWTKSSCIIFTIFLTHFLSYILFFF